MDLKPKQAVLRVIAQSCFIYTILSAAFAALATSIDASLAPTLGTLAQLLLVGVLCALANLILHITSLPLPLRFLLHWAGIMIGVFVPLFLIGGRTAQTKPMLIVAILLTVGYLIFALIYATAHSFRKEEKKPEKYEKQFR